MDSKMCQKQTGLNTPHVDKVTHARPEKTENFKLFLAALL